MKSANRYTVTMASIATNKTPPLFNENDMDYEQWKKDVKLWTIFTDLPKKKVAIGVHLSLTGRARQATSEISIENMQSETGLDLLFEKLDRVFLQDANWKCFNAYLSFENYRRESEASIDEYLSEFDRRHYKLKECGVTLPDAVVACRLIKSCNLNDVHFQLALSTTQEMTFETMRGTLKKLFAESCSTIKAVRSSLPVTVTSDCNEKGATVETYYGERYENRGKRGFSNRRGRWQAPRRNGGNRRGNPIGRDGQVTTCNICGSTLHWARACPDGYNSEVVNSGNPYGKYETPDDEIHITLMAADKFDNKMNTLMGESIGSIILDSGCSKTVCGEEWFVSFVDTLSFPERQSIVEFSSNSVFKFGDGRKMTSIKCVIFPCVLAGKSVKIKTDIVECSIPLLLSKASMKRAGMIIDLINDTVKVFGTSVKLHTASLGHYLLPIYRSPSPAAICEVLLGSGKDDCDRVALKLHRQFAHPSSDKLKKLLQNANRLDEDLRVAVDRVTSECETCRKYKKPRPRPIVSMPMATAFNETVAMDLKSFRGVYFFVMVDMSTRYCIATVIKNKTAETIIRVFFTFWITIFGAPAQILSDNGCEFNNEGMRSMSDAYGIRLLCTAAESPWSNGMCERLNAVLASGVQRIMEDSKCMLKLL